MKLWDLHKRCPWWHFWNPNSGIIGGLIGSVVVAGIFQLMEWLLK